MLYSFRHYLVLFFALPLIVSGQQLRFYGKIINKQTNAPIEKVNLKVANSTQGTSTDKEGDFVLLLTTLPVNIDITCIGYEPLSIEVQSVRPKPLEIRLTPMSYSLEGVTISEKKVVPLYQDQDYSVLDYEIMDDNLLLLVFKYQLNKSVLLLLNRLGDTLAQALLPELPPDRLFRDFFGNVHYFSKNRNAYQGYYDKSHDTLTFPYQLPIDTLMQYLGNFQFVMNDRLYFQEKHNDGFSTWIGYFDKKNGKKYLMKESDRQLAKTYYDKPYLKPDEALEPDDYDNYKQDFGKRAMDLFYKPKCIARMIKLSENRIGLFNCVTDTIEIRNSDWELIAMAPFDFHKETSTNLLTSVSTALSGEEWKWKWKIFADQHNGKVYTYFEKHGKIKLCNVDLNTGKLAAEYEIPLLFVKKINVYKGDAYFLYKEIGEDEKWKLFKMHL